MDGTTRSIRKTKGAKIMDHYSIYAFEKEQKITITNDSKQQLINYLKQPDYLIRRIVVAVPTYEMLDAVYEHVKQELGEGSGAAVTQYITRGYLIHRYSEVNTEYEEDNAPWEYEPHRDKAELDSFLSSDKWENEYKKLLSEEIFPDSSGKRIRISIMLNKLMFIPSIVGELFDNNAQIVMFNSGINDYLDYFNTVEMQDGEWKAVVKVRPDDKCFPSRNCRFRVTHITESKLIADLIRTSYSRLGCDRVTIEQCDHHHPDLPDITLLSDEVVYKRFYGYFPILFETLNKSVWEGSGHCVGDGISSPHSLNRMGYSIDDLTGPVLMKLGEPHPHLLRNLCEQLGGTVQTIKKPLIQHYAQSVISRVAAGSPLYIVCAPRMCGWVEELPAFAEIQRLKTDKGVLQDDGVDVIAGVFSNKFNEVANLSKSKYAFNRWVNANDIVGKDLHKLIAHLLFSVTNTIKEGRDGTEAQPEFRFDEELANGIVLKNKKSPRSRLIRLCGSMVEEHASAQDCRHEVYKRYDAALKGKQYRDDKYLKRKAKSGSHPLNDLGNDVTN